MQSWSGLIPAVLPEKRDTGYHAQYIPEDNEQVKEEHTTGKCVNKQW
jgi:hypothetical protein